MMPQYATYLYSIGLLDEYQRAYFQSMSEKAVAYINDKKFLDAFMVNIDNYISFQQSSLQISRGHLGHDRMVVGFTTMSQKQGIKFTNIHQSMLKLQTHSGFHDLFRF